MPKRRYYANSAEKLDKDLDVYDTALSKLACEDCGGSDFGVFVHADAIEFNCGGCRSEMIVDFGSVKAIFANLLPRDDKGTNGVGHA